MNIQGLTPGNWIKEINRFDYDSKEPLSDLEFQIPEYASFIPYKLDYYQPIPLTEEWLLKFGFEPNHFGWSAHWWLEPIQIVKYNDGFCACTGVDVERDHTWKILCLIPYVHQLQNLYFALTGEELKIK